MGSVSAYWSLERVLALHERELVEEAYEDLPPSLRALDAQISLSNEVMYIGRLVTFVSPRGRVEGLELRGLTIDELAERFPDADVGY